MVEAKGEGRGGGGGGGEEGSREQSGDRGDLAREFFSRFGIVWAPRDPVCRLLLA